MLLEETKNCISPENPSDMFKSFKQNKQMPTFGGVFSESWLTLVFGISWMDWGSVRRTGFRLSGSSRLFVPRTLIALACAASRSFLLSVGDILMSLVVVSENTKDKNYPFNLPSWLKWTACLGDGDFERFLRLLGDLETLRLYLLTVCLFLRPLW